MVLSIEDVDAHAATLRMGTGNEFWVCMCRFVQTFAESDSEKRGWFEFLAAWRTEDAETQI